MRFSMLLLFLLLHSLPGPAEAEILELTLQAGQSQELAVPGLIDDHLLQAPNSYTRYPPSGRFFQRRIILSNSGRVPLQGHLLRINSEDWTSSSALRSTLKLPADPAALAQSVYHFWINHRSHASSATKAAKDPIALLNFWSYGLCGESTKSLAHLLDSFGIPGREVDLNGHIAAEYFYDQSWHVLDGDQNVHYLQLDNLTLASSDQLRSDPFPALRTKVFGKFNPFNQSTAAFNTSFFEFVSPHPLKLLKHKQPISELAEEILFPGETIVYHCDKFPEVPVGASNLQAWGEIRQSALGLIEWQLAPTARRSPAGELRFKSAFPILFAFDPATKRQFPVPPGEPVFELLIAADQVPDKLNVYCQRSLGSFPRLRTGTNQIELAAKAGSARVVFEIDSQPEVSLPALHPSTTKISTQPPEFALDPTPEIDRIWWQISDKESFALLIPNFDEVCAPTQKLTIDSLSTTFFRPGQTYFFRVKARAKTLWGQWSEPISFQVQLPTRPSPIQIQAGKTLRLSWPSAGAGVEYLLFGSNRLDFLPEIFAPLEFISIRNFKIEQTRPNQNLVHTLTEPQIELVPAHRFYRVVTRRAATYSTPSELIVTPPSFAPRLAKAMVLQTRWTKVADPKTKNGYFDDFFASELPLPEK